MFSIRIKSNNAYIVQYIITILLPVCECTQSLIHVWLYSPRLHCPWNFPGNSTGAGGIFYSTESSQPRDWAHVSCASSIEREILYYWHPWGSPPSSLRHHNTVWAKNLRYVYADAIWESATYPVSICILIVNS